MESRMTARSLTWCWQNGGALFREREHLGRRRFEGEDELCFEHLESERPVQDQGGGIQ